MAIIALILLIPMYVGFQQLEVGFEQRDQFDDSIPVVADFIMLSDDFQSSRSPFTSFMMVMLFLQKAGSLGI